MEGRRKHTNVTETGTQASFLKPFSACCENRSLTCVRLSENKGTDEILTNETD